MVLFVDLNNVSVPKVHVKHRISPEFYDRFYHHKFEFYIPRFATFTDAHGVFYVSFMDSLENFCRETFGDDCFTRIENSIVVGHHTLMTQHDDIAAVIFLKYHDCMNEPKDFHRSYYLAVG